jgi:hypothetical protein
MEVLKPLLLSTKDDFLENYISRSTSRHDQLITSRYTIGYTHAPIYLRKRIALSCDFFRFFFKAGKSSWTPCRSSGKWRGSVGLLPTKTSPILQFVCTVYQIVEYIILHCRKCSPQR